MNIKKPSRIEIQLYDALENIICELYADGPTKRGEDRANSCLSAFSKKYGHRHDRKWS